MPTFFKKILSTDLPNTIIDKLENATEATSNLKFDTLPQTKHGNTFLLQALAWNRLTAAKKIINADIKKTSLDKKDSWPTCRNTPLILAAKINATKTIQQLIDLEVNLDEQDYRGFTALHYACMLRNNDIIEKLLQAKAETSLRDAFGNTPLDYYKMEILESDLHYRYGAQDDGSLNPKGDFDNSYFGTKKPCFSALRWYLAHIVTNNELGKNNFLFVDKQVKSIYDLAKSFLSHRKAVTQKIIYNRMIDCFCDNRRNIPLNPTIIDQLQLNILPEFCVEYSTDFKINPFHFVSSSFIFCEDHEPSIELQEIRSFSEHKNN